VKVPGHIITTASFSGDTTGPDGRGAYRFSLWRKNLLADDPGAYAEFFDQYVQFIGLNPSTADERIDDPTVRQCWRRVRRMGYGAFVMTNLFAFRATEPADMKRAAEPVGEWNDEWLHSIAAGAHKIVLAWGAHGKHRGRNVEVLKLLEQFRAKMLFFRFTEEGNHPRHPLYQPAELELKPVAPLWEKFLQAA